MGILYPIGYSFLKFLYYCGRDNMRQNHFTSGHSHRLLKLTRQIQFAGQKQWTSITTKSLILSCFVAIAFATSFGHLKKGSVNPAVKGLQNKENRPRMISELFRIYYKDQNGFITAVELAEETEEISEYSQ